MGPVLALALTTKTTKRDPGRIQSITITIRKFEVVAICQASQRPSTSVQRTRATPAIPALCSKMTKKIRFIPITAIAVTSTTKIAIAIRIAVVARSVPLNWIHKCHYDGPSSHTFCQFIWHGLVVFFPNCCDHINRTIYFIIYELNKFNSMDRLDCILFSFFICLEMTKRKWENSMNKIN